jgi:hypothetical protein
MNGIKILLITGLAFIAVYYFIRLRNSIFDIVLLIAMIATAIFFVLSPGSANDLAHWLGVGRGADLVFYTSILIFWFIILKLYARIRRLEQTITQIVRKEAIDRANTTHGK